MLFFMLLRISFLIYEAHQLKDVPLLAIVSLFWHALRLDVSTAAWLMLFPFVLWTVQSIWPRKFFDTLHIIYVSMMIFVLSAITVGEMGIFDEWKTKLHYKALIYLTQPSEIFQTGETWNLVLLTGIFIILNVIGYLLWKKWFYVATAVITRKLLFSILFLLIMPVLLLIGLRGGTQQIPVNESSCYFSRKEIINLTAINPAWNLLHSVVENRYAMGNNPFVQYPEAEARHKVDALFEIPCDSTAFVLSNPKPNIVLIILEGWSAELSDSLGGDAGITPYFSEMAKDGLLFSQMYNSGTRSQQGISAILSGYPSFPHSVITQHPDKYPRIPSLVKTLDSVGYASSFCFGGALNYGNLRSYITSCGFERITEQRDLPSSLPSGKLGIHDEYMLPAFLGEIDQMSPPFLSAIFTISTHSPYDQQMPDLFNYAYESDYINAAHYSDQCLEVFFTKARSRPWYPNTLFILISDHSHVSYTNRDYFDPEYNRIVCMFYGDVLLPEYRGKQIDKAGSQTDLAPTLLTQMHLNSTSYRWGKNLLNPCSPDYAYFSYEVGLGWIRPWGYYSADYRVDHPFMQYCDSSTTHTQKEIEIEGKSYLQVLYQDFLDL